MDCKFCYKELPSVNTERRSKTLGDTLFRHPFRPKYAILQCDVCFDLFMYLFMWVMFKYSTTWLERSWSDLTQTIKLQLVLKH